MHLYQRLYQARISNLKIISLYIIATFSLCLCYFLGGIRLQLIMQLPLLIMGLILDKSFAKPFNLSIVNSKY